MDKLLSGIRALFGQPSRPTGTARINPKLIAEKAPELVRRLLQRGSIGSDELVRLTQNLTPAQKRAVTGNLDAFRSYFRQARRAQLAGTAGRLAGRGGGILTGLGIGAALQDAVYPRVRGMLPGIDEQSEDDLLQVQRRLEGEGALTESAERFMAGRRADDLERALVEQTRGFDEVTLSPEAARRRHEATSQVYPNMARPLLPILPEGDLSDRVIGDVPEPDASVDRISGRELASYAPFGEEMTLMAQGIKDDDRNPLLQGPPVGLPATRMRPVSVPDSVEAVDSLRAIDPSISEMRINNAFDMLADADSIRGARRDRRRSEAAAQRRTEGIPFMSAAGPEPSATQGLIANAIGSLEESVLPLSMRRMGEMGRIDADAIRAARQEAGERPSYATDYTNRMDAVESLLAPDVDPSIDRGSPFGLPDDISPLREAIREQVAEAPVATPADRVEEIISTLKLSDPVLPEPSFVSMDRIRVPKITSQRQSSAMRADRARPRRRLQPTAPGIFGELLDPSVTDFQGAPMMSEREILRMFRGE
jgi:hypothetical protein